MLQAYAEQSEEISEKLEKFDTSGMNTKEEIYLADVKYRVNKMLDSVKDKLPKWSEEKGEYVLPFMEKIPSTSREPVFSSIPPLPELPDIPPLNGLPNGSAENSGSSQNQAAPRVLRD